MQQSLVEKLNNTAVYLINDKNIPYYLSVPIRNQNKMNIAINITNVLDKNTITNFYKTFDNGDISLITPIFNSDILNQISNLNNDYYTEISNYLSYLINNVYKMLSNNNLIIDNKIFLVKNNIFNDFNDWFSKKYGTRVSVIEYPNNNSNTTEKENLNPNTNINPVNGLPNTKVDIENKKEEVEVASDVLDNTQNFSSVSVPSVNDEGKDLGFVSYVLLGVIVAVASLAILYVLI